MLIEDDEIDNYHMSIRTEKPPEVEWDLKLTQQPGKEQKVTKVVEEVGGYISRGSHGC